MAMKKYGHGGYVPGVTSGNEEWEATGRPFTDERGRRLVPCRRVDDHSVTRDMSTTSFAWVPKTSRRVCNGPVEVGDLSGCGQVCAVGKPVVRGGTAYVLCVWLDKPDVIVEMRVGNFRRGFRTSVRHGENPIVFGEKYGNYRIGGYGEVTDRGVQLYAGTCEGCGFESRTLRADNLRRAKKHECSKLRDRAGFTANGYTVVKKQWAEGAVHWVVRNTETGREELWTPSRVEVDIAGDLALLDRECAAVVRAAALRGEDSPVLREVGTTVAEVQRYLPLSHYTRGDHLGHIFPRKLCLTPRTRVASWHPRLLRWITPERNQQMGSLAWLEMFADPVVAAAARVLLAMCLEDLHRLYPEGQKRHKRGRGKISDLRRERFGLPTRDEEIAAWEREKTAIRGMYGGYADPATLDGSEVYGGFGEGA